MMVSACYLNNGDLIDIYSDIIHKLIHVKQFMEDEKLFDDRYDYVVRPTEIEAYRRAVEEAHRLGLDDARICRYLKQNGLAKENCENLRRHLMLSMCRLPKDEKCI